MSMHPLGIDGDAPPWHCSRHHLMDTVCGELAFACRGARFVIVDAAGAGLAARRDEILPAAATPGGAGPADVRYVVEPRPPAWDGRAEGYRVLRDGALRYLGRDVTGLVRWLRADLAATAGWRSAEPLVLRAAALTWRERAILLPGPAGCGTSRLVAELVRLGASCRSEQFVALDDEARIGPHPAHPGTRPLEVATVVSKTFRPELSWQPRRLRGARAVLPVVASVLTGGHDPRRALRRCARLAPCLVTLQGPRPEAAVAAPRILAALDELLGVGAPARGGLPAPLARAQRALLRSRDG